MSNKDNTAEAVQQSNTTIAASIALGFVSIMTDATNDLTQLLVSGEATTENILALLNDVLADIQSSATKFQTLTANFDRVCSDVREGEIA